MTQSEQIITSARRYCIDIFQTSLSTRQGIASSILKEIEFLVGKEFQNIEDCKKELLHLGLIGLINGTRHFKKEGHLKLIPIERQNYVDFITQLDSTKIKNVDPLPYRRRMPESEANAVRQNLKTHWNFDGNTGYWDPLTSCCTKPFVYFSKENLTDIDLAKIKNIVSSIEDSNIYEVSEEWVDYEVDKEEFDTDYCGYEIIYSDKNFEWIIYCSHEGTITFAGTWLLTQIEEHLNDKMEFKNKW